MRQRKTRSRRTYPFFNAIKETGKYYATNKTTYIYPLIIAGTIAAPPAVGSIIALSGGYAFILQSLSGTDPINEIYIKIKSKLKKKGYSEKESSKKAMQVKNHYKKFFSEHPPAKQKMIRNPKGSMFTYRKE